MCGIFGYVGKKNAVKTVLNGLKKLEYRGYDSAGIAGIKDGKISFAKEVGKVSQLEKEVEAEKMELDMAIAQTRWATHGKVTKTNAHPHLDSRKSLALVHNGIIENYEVLKRSLQKEGVHFLSETDTEVIAHMIAKFYKGNLLEAVQKAVRAMEGSYSVLMIHQDFPDTMVAVSHGAPLVIGLGQEEAFVSSDSHAFAFHTKEAVYLSTDEIAIIEKDKLEIFNTDNVSVERAPLQLEAAAVDASKGAFEHYTLKEIFDQPQAIRSALLGRFLEEYGQAFFENLNFEESDFLQLERILILGCGTSYHAGMIAGYLFEEMAGIPTQVEISSEYRYKNPVIQPNTLVIAISQSGETADTLAAIRELKTKGAKILALCNVYHSSIAREADDCIYLKAGPEIGVCSTKAFTSQLTVLALLSLLLSRVHQMKKSEGKIFIDELLKIPEAVQQVLDHAEEIKQLAKKYAHYQNFFFLGRNLMYPTSLEGALKLKEISYINASGYPAGEMKHGPIALINEDCPTVALCANSTTYQKLLSNLMEVKARNGKILAVTDHLDEELKQIADDVFVVPKTIDALAPIVTTIFTQLFAYYIAKIRGADIDQPRNLAKSVTVE